MIRQITESQKLLEDFFIEELESRQEPFCICLTPVPVPWPPFLVCGPPYLYLCF
jgi:hypothetical protein